MGGGASKSHRKPNASVESDQAMGNRAMGVERQQNDTEDERQLPRIGKHVKFGNDMYDENGFLSPNSSGDEEDDEFDQHQLNDNDDDDDEGERDDDEGGAGDEEAMQLRMLFAQSAMSMDMDNEDLIFNLLYFGGDTSNFATMMNNAAEETVAAHSTGNTPYKLAPATALALKKLQVMLVTEELVQELNLQDCLICQEEFEVNQEIAEIPGCCHCFHNECVLKWFTLQSWCPVCRTKIVSEDEDGDICADDEEADAAVVTKRSISEDISMANVKSNLTERFDDAADNRMEEVAA